MPAALLGSVAPDLDLFYFYLIDGARTHHHHYVTHVPLFWAAVAVLTLVPMWYAHSRYRAAALAFFVGVLSHMALDSIAAPTYWLAPFSNIRTELFPVPATHSHWIVSFVLHWTFLIEVAISLLALAVLAASRPGKARMSAP